MRGILKMKQPKVTKTHMVLFSTAGTWEEASRISTHLVENRLVACVNLVPSISSVYWWKNQVNQETEVLLIMKTEKSKVTMVEKAIRSLHSYQTPELIGLKVEYGLPEYLAWVSASTSDRKRKK
jgi:periplasmic divalent cation tolerance protein